MKNYKEIADSVFLRKEQFEKERKKKRKTMALVMIPVFLVCITVFSGFEINRGGFLETQPTKTAEDAIYPGIKDNFDELNGESPDNPEQNNKIVVNKISAVNSDRMNICLSTNDFIKMNKEEINTYFGVDIFPTVADDLKEWQSPVYGIYKRDGGTGEVYWDGQVLNYSNEDFTRNVNIEIEKGSLPFLDFGFSDVTQEEKSIINNWEVFIGFSESSGFHATFMYKDVGFYVGGDGLSQDEFTAVLSSIIK